MTQDCQAEKCSKEHFSCNSGPFCQMQALSYSAGHMDTKEQLGARVRELRNARRLSQDALGEQIGSDGPRIHRIEKGGENPTVETLDKIAIALKVEIGQLFIPVR